jgi:exodeoxyribonuclease VII large subunit
MPGFFLFLLNFLFMLTGKSIYTVSLLTKEVKKLLEASYVNIQVEGEISGLKRPVSGHQYFNLKDEFAQLRCVFFKNSARLSNIELANGMQVILTARVSLYEQRGDFQLIVRSIVESGEGLLRKRFEQLKIRLADEGLFELSKKSALPSLPACVGIITSPSGAAIHDIISVFKRRYPSIRLLVYPAVVQGEKAAESLVTAISTAGSRMECDVLILARGGGSLEDLWPFNEEIVARAIYNCSLPLVSAVGHETDFSISDLVADARAATPTAAAEMLSPDKDHLSRVCKSLQLRIFNAATRLHEALSQQLDLLQTRLILFKQQTEQDKYRFSILSERFSRLSDWMIRDKGIQLSSIVSRIHSPEKALDQRRQHCLNLEHRLLRGAKQRVSSAKHVYAINNQRLSQMLSTYKIENQSIILCGLSKRLSNRMPDLLKYKNSQLEKQAYALQTLSPLQTLARGFATLQFPGEKSIVSSVDQVKIGDELQANLHNGYLHCKIIRLHRNNHD